MSHKYKKITAEHQESMLAARITELEQQHFVTSLNIKAAKALAAGEGLDEAQKESAQQEVAQGERMLAGLETALKALT